MEEHFLVLDINSFSMAHLAIGLFVIAVEYQLQVIDLWERSLGKTFFATLSLFANHLSEKVILK